MITNRARYRSLTLSERRRLRRLPTEVQGPEKASELARAKRRLERWRTQQTFGTIGFQTWWGSADLDEQELLALMAASDLPSSADLAEATPWFDAIKTIYESYKVVAGNETDLDIVSPRPIDTFSPILNPLILWAEKRLVREEVGPHSPVKRIQSNGLFSFVDLRNQLWSVLSRTLVLELNIARLEGSLEGFTPEERFDAFAKRFMKPAYSCSFFAEYPVLARLVVGTMDCAIKAHTELLSRLCKDWESIKGMFENIQTSDQVVDVSFGVGDFHRGGRSVAILTFDSGARLVYKPKSLAVDLHFQQIIKWLAKQGEGFPKRSLSILDCGEYGWMEHVEPKPCVSQEEVGSFYRRQGSYLALLHCMAGTDAHYQNLIAVGEHPILIDLETLFHPPLPAIDSFDQFVQEAIHSSVLTVGLLPIQVWINDDGEGIDLSGLGNDAQQSSPTPVPHWDDPFTDQMRLVRKHAKLQGSANRACLNGQETFASDHSAEILAGFSATYRVFMSKDLVQPAIDLFSSCVNDDTRIVLRPTSVYANLLGESYHPDILRDALDREWFFHQLWIPVHRQPFLSKVVPIEREDLFSGDVPLFNTQPGSHDLSGGSSRIVENFFAKSAFSVVEERISNLSDDDLQRQLFLVEASLAGLTARSEARHNIWIRPQSAFDEDPSLTRESLREAALETARAIADRLATLAVHGAEGQTSWISLLRRTSKHWALAGLGHDLYSGLPGLALFFAYLEHVTGEHRYRVLAESTLKTLISGLPSYFDGKPNVGAFDGLGGVVYLFTHLGVLWGRAELIERAESITTFLPGMVDSDLHLDVIAGTAGCAAAVMSLHEHVPSEGLVQLLERCGVRLVARAMDMPAAGKAWLTTTARRTPLAGFSHGTAGIAWALLRIADLTNNDYFRQVGLAAINYEHSLFLSESHNWPDYRENPERPHETLTSGPLISAWCHGATGIGLGRLSEFANHRNPVARADVTRAVTRTLSDALLPNHSLCHGNLGNLDFLIQAADLVHLPNSEIETRSSRILRSIESSGWRCGVPQGVQVPGLMRGVSGIAYGLLRVALPSQIPSVLTLAPPRHVALK